MKTILFDFGNVIGYFDHWRAVRRFVRHTKLSGDQIYAALYDSDLEYDFEAGRLTGEEFIRLGKRAIQYAGSDDEFRAAYIDIFTPNEPICALIPLLKPPYRLVLASNTNELHSLHYRSLFRDVLQHFDGLGLSFEAGVRKPHPDFYRHCLKWADCAPEECVFIDDMPVNVEGAQVVGMRGLLYDGDEELLADLHRLEIEY